MARRKNSAISDLPDDLPPGTDAPEAPVSADDLAAVLAEVQRLRAELAQANDKSEVQALKAALVDQRKAAEKAQADLTAQLQGLGARLNREKDADLARAAEAGTAQRLLAPELRHAPPPIKGLGTRGTCKVRWTPHAGARLTASLTVQRTLKGQDGPRAAVSHGYPLILPHAAPGGGRVILRPNRTETVDKAFWEHYSKTPNAQAYIERGALTLVSSD